MPNIIFPFNEVKTSAVAEAILRRLGGKTNYMYLLKLVYFADRYHLRKDLRPATSDRYFAMKRGAVASYLYDVCKGDRYSDIFVPLENYQVALRNDTDRYEDELSNSDIESIKFSLSNFAEFGEFNLSIITHAYPEWKKYEGVIISGKSRSEEMNFVDFLENADPDDPIFRRYGLRDPYPPISEEEKELMKDELFEISSQFV